MTLIFINVVSVKTEIRTYNFLSCYKDYAKGIIVPCFEMSAKYLRMFLSPKTINVGQISGTTFVFVSKTSLLPQYVNI